MKEEKRKESKANQAEEPLIYLPPFREEIKRMIQESGIPVLRIAKKMGISRSRLDYHLKGNRRISPEVLNEIKKAVNELKGDLEISKPEVNTENKIPLYSIPEYKTIGDLTIFPVLKSFKFIDGAVDLTENNIYGYTIFPYDFENDCFCVTNNSADDMNDTSSPRSIEEGDILLVDPKVKVISGDVVIAKVFGDRDLIRMISFRQEDDKVELIPFNSKYPALVINKADIDHIFKIVVKQGKPVKM